MTDTQRAEVKAWSKAAARARWRDGPVIVDWEFFRLLVFFTHEMDGHLGLAVYQQDGKLKFMGRDVIAVDAADLPWAEEIAA